MKKAYKYVLFDLDGTIVDSGNSIMAATAYALKQAGRQVPSDDVLKKFVGPPLIDSFMRYSGMTRAEAVEAVDLYRVYYNDMGGIFDCSVYDGIEDALKALVAEGKVLAVATTKPVNPAIKLLDHFDLLSYFAVVAGDTDDCTRSAKSDVIAYCLEELGNPDKSSVIMVGDREHDVIGANLNGIDSVGVLYGFGTHDEFVASGAKYIVALPRDVVKVGE